MSMPEVETEREDMLRRRVVQAREARYEHSYIIGRDGGRACELVTNSAQPESKVIGLNCPLRNIRKRCCLWAGS